jgi:hypothetical protein
MKDLTLAFRHGQGMASFERGNAVKELLETCAVMIDIEFVDEAAIGQADGDAVTDAANINANAKGVGVH